MVLPLQECKGMTLFERFCMLSMRHRVLDWEIYVELSRERVRIRDFQDLMEKVNSLTSIDLSMEDLDWTESERETLLKHKVSWSTPEDENYPLKFRENFFGPLFISYWGAPVWQNWRWLAVVGSRTPFKETLSWLDMELPRLFFEKDWSILSGGARGVDQKSHATCLRHRKPTICVVPSGLGELYPRELNNWREPILRDGGCLLSGFPFHSVMNKGCFHIRNKWLVRLSEFVLVAQAARRSGSAMTGRFAVEMLGKERVMTLPCSPLSRQGLGGLDLLADGDACIARDGMDIQAKAGSIFTSQQHLVLNFSKGVNSESEKESIH